MKNKKRVVLGVFVASVSMYMTVSLFSMLPVPSAEPIRPIDDQALELELNTPLVADRARTNAAITGDAEAEADAAQAESVSFASKETVQKRGNDKVIIAENGKEYPLRVYTPLALPNDPYAAQWWVGGTDLEGAWDRGPGSHETTVAIIDTGFALDHEEFAGRWHTNTGESGATTQEAGGPYNCTQRGLSLDKSCNGIDDDGNGFIDDVRGWDFAGNDNSVQSGETNASGDDAAHGTMVAGILAASGNNSTGLAGVNWATRVLPLQALDDDGYGDTLSVARAVRYAADQHADIINLSLGSTAPDEYLREAIAYAHEAGALVVAASGNEACDCVAYPARYAEVLSVGSLSSAGTPSSYSSYGASLDIIAPGEQLITTSWTAQNQTSAYVGGAAGTSFATPYVVGLLALAKSHAPTASWGELVAALIESSSRPWATTTQLHRAQNGYGSVRAEALLSRVLTPRTDTLRYQLGPIVATDALDSSRVYQCEGGALPATPVYEVTKGSSLVFTASEHARYQLTHDGWTSKLFFYGCVGLPVDQPAYTRNINMPREFYNRYDIR